MAPSFPDTLARSLRALASLPQSQYESFLKYLRQIPPQIKHESIFSGADQKIPEVGEHSEAVKSAAFSLLLSKVRGQLPIHDFVSELVEALSSRPGFEEESARNTLRARATEILSIKSLDVIARAHDVLTVHACAYVKSRILSDLRPVFGDDVGSTPIGAVLVHMLSIHYLNLDQLNAFVVGLDEKDVDELLEVLQRAKRKSRTLRDTLRKTDVPYIEVV
jgi:hypothetical protein